MEALNKGLSREKSGKIKMARNASTIVSEILNNVSSRIGKKRFKRHQSTRKSLRKRYEPIDFSSTADKPT